MSKVHVTSIIATDVEECSCKIQTLLREYNCTIEVDEELNGSIVLVDQDTEKFEFLVEIDRDDAPETENES